MNINDIVIEKESGQMGFITITPDIENPFYGVSFYIDGKSELLLPDQIVPYITGLKPFITRENVKC